MCAICLACTPCQSLNMVSLSLSGFDETKELQFRNSLDETCTATSQGTAHSQTDRTDSLIPGPSIQPPHTFSKQLAAGGVRGWKQDSLVPGLSSKRGVWLRDYRTKTSYVHQT